MAIQSCGLNLNKARRELQPHGSVPFPCAAYATRCADRPDQAIPWHDHEELEIAYLKEGRMCLQLPGKTYLLEQGDCAVINANTLHAATAAPQCLLHSIVFHIRLVAGDSESVFSTQYLQPLITQTSFQAYLFRGGKRQAEIACFKAAFDAIAHEAPGFEFTVRENLSKLCWFLYVQFAHEIPEAQGGENQDQLRVRKVLDYIHANFSQALTLSQLAKAADIGERECLRCFQRTIQLSPMQYLLKYRMMQGAQLLTQVGAACGFDSPSHFSQTFKRFYRCTPRQYRSANDA